MVLLKCVVDDSILRFRDSREPGYQNRTNFNRHDILQFLLLAPHPHCLILVTGTACCSTLTHHQCFRQCRVVVETMGSLTSPGYSVCTASILLVFYGYTVTS